MIEKQPAVHRKLILKRARERVFPHQFYLWTSDLSWRQTRLCTIKLLFSKKELILIDMMPKFAKKVHDLAFSRHHRSIDKWRRRRDSSSISLKSTVGLNFAKKGWLWKTWAVTKYTTSNIESYFLRTLGTEMDLELAKKTFQFQFC